MIRSVFGIGWRPSVSRWLSVLIGWLLVSGFVQLGSRPAAGQSSDRGTLTGYVVDARTGERLTGANVGLAETRYGDSSDENGYFELTNIPTGSYRLQASYIGYEPWEQMNVTIRTAGVRPVRIELNPSTAELEEVVVTYADPFRASPEQPISYRSLSRSEIATYPAGNSDIAKVAQSLPGISGSVTGFRNDVIIRGGSPNENVYYLDGIEIPTINHFSTQGSAGGPAGLLNVTFFEGVEISTSSFPASYGDALSGVLQFDQRRGDDRKRRTQFRVGASEAAITTEGPLFKGEKPAANTTYLLSVRRSYLQLLFDLIGLPFLPDYWDYQYKLSHRTDRGDEIYLTGVGSIDDFRINIPSSPDPDQEAVLEQVPVIGQQTHTGGIGWRRPMRGVDGFWQTHLAISHFSNDFRRYRDNRVQDQLFLENRSDEKRRTLRTGFQRLGSDWTLSAGVLIRSNEYQNRFSDLNRGTGFENRLPFWSYGLYSQLSREPEGSPFGWTMGLRTDGNTFTETGHQLARTLSPRAGLSWRLTESGRWVASMSAGRYTKLPPFTLLGYRTTAGYANREIDYQIADHVTAGLATYPRPSLKVSAEAFYKRYRQMPVSLEDGVSLANKGGGFEVLGNEAVYSSGEGQTWGVEFLVQQKMATDFYGILAITLFQSQFTGLDGDRYRPSLWDSRYLLTFTGGYQFSSKWEMSLRSRWIGKTPFAPVDTSASLQTYPDFVFDYDRLGDVRLNPFRATDIRLDRRFDFTRAGISLDLYLEIQNVLGQDAPREPQYLLVKEGEERRLERVDQYADSSILPTIGLILEF